MSKYVRKFEAKSSFSPNNILSEYKMTTKDLDKIIDDLDKYQVDSHLLADLISSVLSCFTN